MAPAGVLNTGMPVRRGSAARHWCFTINNPTDDARRAVQELIDNPDVAYVVVGREIGETGTPHLQGFLSLEGRKRFAQVIALFDGIHPHLEAARNVRAAADYCKKDGDFDEYGTVPENSSGKRSDLELFKEAVVAGNTDLKSLMELHSDVYARYTRFVIDYVQLHKPKRDVEQHELMPWQLALKEQLDGAPDDRTINFYVDATGNNGKTWFSHWYASVTSNVQVLQPGKKADMAHCLDDSCNVFIFDAPRSKQGEYIQYDFLEDIKNGYVFSPKYESRVKVLPKCHVVVMMNEEPDMTKLSADRYLIVNL